MRILILTNRIPYPPSDGGAIASYNMMKGLVAAGAEVSLLALNTNKHFLTHEKLPEVFSRLNYFDSTEINTDIKAWDALKNLTGNSSYNIIRFYSKTHEEKLIKLLQENEFDVIHLEGLHISIYLQTIRKYSNAKVVLRAHNIEHLIWERLYKAEKKPLKKMYLRLLTNRMKKYETDVVKKIDGVVPITKVDENFFSKDSPQIKVHTSATGIDMNNYTPDYTTTNHHTVFHLGAMNWLPNVQAVEWYVENCHDAVAAQYKKYECHIAGRNIPQHIQHLKKEKLFIDGEITDAHSYINAYGIMIVPLLSGSGMRIKIIEGMALGKAIVSTTVGAEGIAYTHGKNILIADTPKEFANAVLDLLNNPAKQIETGKEARHFAEKNFDNNTLSKAVLDFYQSMIK